MSALYRKCYLERELGCSYMIVSEIEDRLHNLKWVKEQIHFTLQEHIKRILTFLGYVVFTKLDGGTYTEWKNTKKNTPSFMLNARSVFTVLVARCYSRWEEMWTLCNTEGDWIVKDVYRPFEKEMPLSDFLRYVRTKAEEEFNKPV